MAERIREITVGDRTFRVSNLRGILNPGKFEGEMPHAVRDYQEVPDEEHSFGEASDESVFRVGHRCYLSDSQGFITEIKAEEYQRLIATDGILVEDGEWSYYGQRVAGPVEAALRAHEDLGDAGEPGSLVWRSLRGDELATLSDDEIGGAVAAALVDGEPCAFNADVYCADDARAIAEKILSDPTASIGRLLQQEDSEILPQPMGTRETDSPEHCACGPKCRNAIELSNGQKVGALLPGQVLTRDGEQYVRDCLRENPTEVTRLWAKECGIKAPTPKRGPSL